MHTKKSKLLQVNHLEGFLQFKMLDVVYLLELENGVVLLIF